MAASSRYRRLHLLSIVFAIAPFLFAFIRAFNSRADFRMLWMAFASFIGATAVIVIGRARSRPRRQLLPLSVVALFVATLLAAWTAMRLGARAPFGVWAVSFVLGLCWTVSWALDTLSRPPKEV